MKRIKIILGIISVFTIAFFVTGLLVKQISYVAEVSINKPVAEVFEQFNNPQNTKYWIHEVISIDTLQTNMGKIGSLYKIVLENEGEKITMTEKVLSYVPNEKVTLFFDAENMLKTDDYLFSEKDGITTINLKTISQSESYIMACLLPFFKGKLQEQSQQYLNNFKEFIESDADSLSEK